MSKLTKLIQWIYSTEGYYFFKSGMYLDFYIKNIFTTFWTQLNIFLGIFFLEKFIVERFTKKITNNFLFIYTSILNIKKIRATSQFLIIAITILMFILCYFIIVF